MRISFRTSCWSTRRSAAVLRDCAERSRGAWLRKASRRASWRTSVSVITVLPTTTAMRSTTAAERETLRRRTHATRRNGARRDNAEKTLGRVPILERLSYGDEELKMGDALDGRGCGPQDQFLVGAFQAEIGWRIDAVGQVYADRAYGRAVANAEADRMHHVIEVLIIAL